MPLQQAEVIFNDSPSRYNKDLTDFLKRNIEPIIMKGQVKLKFRIAKPADLSKLRSNGIKRLPAMILQGKNIIGVQDIVECLRTIVKTSKRMAAPKSNDEILSDYFKKTLGDIKQDDGGKILLPEEENEEDEFDPQDAIHRELERRGNTGADGGNERKRRQKTAPRRPPPKPDRQAEQDDDYEDDRMPVITNRPDRGQRRPDNVDQIATDIIGDPMASLNRIQNRGGGEGAHDDDAMMRTLMDRIGTSADI